MTFTLAHIKFFQMKKSILTCSLYMLSLSACTQVSDSKMKDRSPAIGGNCEGCEAIYETKVPFEKLSWIDTLPDFFTKGPQLEVSGVVLKKDGTPAAGVIVYAYHTDQTGRYPTKGNETGWGRRHGYIRGWVKTNGNGQYKFLTLRPGAYPSGGNPEHIHLTVKEPDKNEYWIDDIQFDDDKYLTSELRRRQQNRGGNGIAVVKKKDAILYAERNIYLGKNIPHYR